jgi:hypothetical protein
MRMPLRARMIDGALPTMIDEVLPRRGKLPATAVADGAQWRHLS